MHICHTYACKYTHTLRAHTRIDRQLTHSYTFVNIRIYTHIYTTHTHTNTHIHTHTPLFFVFKNPSSSPNFFFLNKSIYLFYFWLHWVFVAVRGLSLVAASGGYSSLRCAGFSLPGLLLLRSTGSRCVGFSSCGTRAQ